MKKYIHLSTFDQSLGKGWNLGVISERMTYSEFLECMGKENTRIKLQITKEREDDLNIWARVQTHNGRAITV